MCIRMHLHCVNPNFLRSTECWRSWAKRFATSSMTSTLIGLHASVCHLPTESTTSRFQPFRRESCDGSRSFSRGREKGPSPCSQGSTLATQTTWESSLCTVSRSDPFTAARLGWTMSSSYRPGRSTMPQGGYSCYFTSFQNEIREHLSILLIKSAHCAQLMHTVHTQWRGVVYMLLPASDCSALWLPGWPAETG